MQWSMINVVDTNNNRKEKRARDDRRVRIVDEVMVQQQQKNGLFDLCLYSYIIQKISNSC
jgi:hypothetical protein